MNDYPMSIELDLTVIRIVFANFSKTGRINQIRFGIVVDKPTFGAENQFFRTSSRSFKCSHQGAAGTGLFLLDRGHSSKMCIYSRKCFMFHVRTRDAQVLDFLDGPPPPPVFFLLFDCFPAANSTLFTLSFASKSALWRVIRSTSLSLIV